MIGLLWAFAVQAEELELVVKNPGMEARMFRLQDMDQTPEEERLAPDLAVPLGSLWKLLVYVYLVEKQQQPPAYTCRGQEADEIFCCKPGGMIAREEALYRSCGLFFAPARLRIADRDWQRFWVSERQLPFSWLVSLKTLRPDAQVPVAQLVEVLETIRRVSPAFRQTEEVLAQTTLIGTARGSYRQLGSLLRVKTWTWDARDRKGLDGGFAGWVEGGAVVWARSRGTSHRMLDHWGNTLGRLIQQATRPAAEDCVRVAYFDRYPLQAVLRLPDSQAASEGPMRGAYRLEFAGGTRLDVADAESLSLQKVKTGYAISGRFGVNEYVARVLEREAATQPLEAARALSVAIRTYLLQNARSEGNCLLIADSSHAQRVSPQKPGKSALAIARWGDRLIWDQVPGLRYHRDREGMNRLAWKQAVHQAREGAHFDAILSAAYPGGRLAFAGRVRQAQCRRLAVAENWIRGQEKFWASRLIDTPGFQPPDAVRVCYSDSGAPYAAPQEGTIFGRFSGDAEDQLSLLHEYLHLGFRYHPKGRDERFIEQLAQSLLALQAQGMNHAKKSLAPARHAAASRAIAGAEH